MCLVGDVKRDEERSGIKGELASKVFDLVGGRMIHLGYVASKLSEGDVDLNSMWIVVYEYSWFLTTFTAIRHKLYSDAKSQLQAASILPGYTYHKDGASVIRALFENGPISSDVYYGLIGVEIGEMLLETNVFSYNPATELIDF